MKKLPIGVNDFHEMIKKEYYFVDKSMLIKDIIDLPGKIKLITRPRRFGKTLNMSMIEHFFSLFRKENLFDDLLIWNERRIVKENYHKYPVISISFKEIKDTTWKIAFDHIKRVLANIANSYRTFAKDDADSKYITSIAMKEASEGDYSEILRHLTKLVHEETGKKAILLIDEYDVPIEAAYTYRNKDPDYYDNMVAFMRNMLTAALKDNEHLEFGILTGVYRVAKESIFSGLNNLAVYSVFENEMAERFGFTENETFELLRYYGLSEHDMREVSEWYGGFRFGKCEPLYNPWSVIYYIKERTTGKRNVEEALQPFWINTSSNDIIEEHIMKNPHVKEKLEELLKGYEIVERVNPWLSLRELEEAPEGVWTLLVSSGYLTAKWEEYGVYSIKVPNREVLEFFKEVVMKWVTKLLRVRMPEMYVALSETLKEGKGEKLGKFLEKFVQNSLSYFDIGGTEPERVYKALLLGMLSIAINGYVVESEVESGYGRLDLVIYPKEKSHGDFAAIFEVKRADKSDKHILENLANKALLQIKERNYYTRMKTLGYKVIGFGIAFCGKAVRVISSEIS